MMDSAKDYVDQLKEPSCGMPGIFLVIYTSDDAILLWSVILCAACI
jgi:hypothetical protein